MLKITNIKASLKLQSVSLDSVENECKEKNIAMKRYPNFLVIKTKYTYVLFKKNKNNYNHMNITKIPSFDKVNDSIKFFSDLYNIPKECIKEEKIDNITANFSLNKIVDLQNFAKLYKDTYCVTYKNETFSGLSIKFEYGTVLIFHTGNCVIIGCKNKKDIEWIVEKIRALTLQK